MIALPIDSLQAEFSQTFEGLGDGGRIVLTAPTGSGKSTRVPVWCRDGCQGRVLVIEPRRVAARTLAGWVAKGQNEPVGQSVGYSVRFESRHNAETQILFVTPGVARRFLVDGIVNDFAVVVFDEFHERSWETDALLAVLAARSRGPKLVIMSATLMADQLVERYKAKLLEAEGRAFPVTVSYHDGGESELTVPSTRNLVSRVSRAVRRAWEQDNQGSVLVFLPGLASMSEVASGLGQLPTVLLHGTFSQKEQARAFSEDERKIVLATNVAESSLTIPGITTVVDSGLERRQIHQSGYVALATVPVALSSADQRTGRAGRVCAGRSLRLWSQEGRLETTRPPDICRMELDELVLFFSALDQGLSTPAEWVDPPPAFAWERAKERLEKSGSIDSEGFLTELGRGVQKLPVDQEWARLLLSAPSELRGDLADLCALATARRSPIKNTRSEDVIKARKEDWGEEPWGQALAILRVGDPVRHALGSEGLQICRRVSDELRSLIEAGSRAKDVLKPQPGLRDFLARMWPERFFLLRGGRDAWGNGQVECRLGRGEELPDDCVAAFMLQVNPTLARGLKVELQARWGLPVRFSLLRKAGIGEPELSKIRWLNGALQARVVWKHAGRDLGSAEEVLNGSALRKALATLAAQSRWRKEATKLMLEEHYYRRLSAALAGREFSERSLDELMEARLQELGVQECADLELLEDSDFLTGDLPSYELEKLQTDYPQLYRFGGLTFEMEYDPKKRRVTMNSLSKGKGVKVNPQHLPRWNGWKVELNERGRKTVLRG
jgi:ATP-dependent RNA helicase HrpB